MLEIYLSSCANPDLFRPANWRWLRAKHLAATGEAPTAQDDPWVMRAKCHLIVRATIADESECTSDANFSPPVEEALCLHQQPKPQTRWLVEALLLTSVPIDEIAQRCDLPADTVEAYNALFFDVRQHICAHDWIAAQAVGTTWRRGFSGLSLGAVWKHIAFVAGPDALALIVFATLDEPPADWARPWFDGQAAYEEARLRLLDKLHATALITESSDDWEILADVRKRLPDLGGESAGQREQFDVGWSDEMREAQIELLKRDASRGQRHARRHV